MMTLRTKFDNSVRYVSDNPTDITVAEKKTERNYTPKSIIKDSKTKHRVW